MMMRGGNLNKNSFESRYDPIRWICWVLFALFLLPQIFILIAIAYFKITDLLYTWMFFLLAFSDISLFGWSMYTLRTYIREDSFDWASLMSNVVINTNNVPYMMKLATNMVMSANKHNQVVAQSPDITIKALSDDNDSDSEFD
jgi:hypothetical protein